MPSLWGPDPVTGAAPDERSEVLTAQPASVGRARRLVIEALRAWALDDLIDDATLLVSEVVTNAVLHAGTEVGITIRRAGNGVRIEVADGSPITPTPRNYDGGAVTGRGLQILRSTASGWGSTVTASGKVVWFDVGPPQPGAGPAGTPDAGRVDEWVIVRWEGLPPLLVKTTLEHGDAMLRELALVSFDRQVDRVPMAPIVTPALDLRDLLSAIDGALVAGVHVTDLTVGIPAASVDAAIDRLALVDEADRMAGEDELLIPPALPEIVACRHWLLGEIVAQAAGDPPRRWRLGTTPGPDRAWQPLSDAEMDILGVDLPNSIVADQNDRIVFIGEDAAGLLGWSPAALAGRRVTDIIPPDLREAHLVGFTRFQLAGRPAVAGVPLALRARRADGTEIQVSITLEPLPRRIGRLRHRARLTAAAHLQD